MPLPNTTGTEKTFRREALQIGALEFYQPATVAAIAGAATLNQAAGIVTSESVTTAAQGFYTLTLTNSLVDVNSMVFASARNGTSTQGHPSLSDVTEGAGFVKIVVVNDDVTNAFNGTVQVKFFVVRKAGANL